MSFEHIAPKLFSSSTHNRGRCRLDLDEACFIYDMVRKFKAIHKRQPKILEIGTYKAGSTALMASAGGYVVSIDNYCSSSFKNNSKNIDEHIAKQIDNNLEFLNKNDLQDCFLLGCESVGEYPCVENEYDILFIDADHKYESVKADYNYWIDSLKDGGHLLFHDSCGKEKGRIRNSEVPQFMPEVPYRKWQEVGSITHFIKE